MKFHIIALLMLGCLAQGRVGAEPQGQVPVAPGHATVVLNGPWRFRIGDDASWAMPGFNDSAWDVVDLTPAPQAHDGDVGLTGYVAGWRDRGYPGYSGYAWYRLSLTIQSALPSEVALTGPPSVDDAYQVFVNGRLLGGEGRFSNEPPTIYSIQPKLFPFPQELRDEIHRSGTAVVALRVWMASWTASQEDSGGVHIAPVLGNLEAVKALHRQQWRQTILGYLADAVEPTIFVLLALFAWRLKTLDRSDPAYGWLMVSLLLIAAQRAEQVLFFWTQWQSLILYDLVRNVLLVPLTLGAWVVTWRAWLKLRTPAVLSAILGLLVLLYILSQLLMRQWLTPSLSEAVRASIAAPSAAIRIVCPLLEVHVAAMAVRRDESSRWMVLPAILLSLIGLFAQELSALGLPGIWFPYGVGVSRTQFAYAGFDVALSALLTQRFLTLAARRHAEQEVSA